MTKHKPKLPRSIGAALLEAEKRIAESDTVRKQLDASKAATKRQLDAIKNLAAERTRRRHLDEEKVRARVKELIAAPRSAGDLWDLPEGRTQSEPDITDHWEPVIHDAKPLANPIHERMDLVPWDGVLAVARTMTEGVQTHDEGAWRKLSQREHVSRAIRHLALFLTGDSAEPHLEHACCRTLMALSQWPQAQEGEPDVY